MQKKFLKVNLESPLFVNDFNSRQDNRVLSDFVRWPLLPRIQTDRRSICREQTRSAGAVPSASRNTYVVYVTRAWGLKLADLLFAASPYA